MHSVHVFKIYNLLNFENMAINKHLPLAECSGEFTFQNLFIASTEEYQSSTIFIQRQVSFNVLPVFTILSCFYCVYLLLIWTGSKCPENNNHSARCIFRTKIIGWFLERQSLKPDKTLLFVFKTVLLRFHSRELNVLF